jgi:ribonucleotide monophosphatase NagD (HAD superfamily)
VDLRRDFAQDSSQDWRILAMSKPISIMVDLDGVVSTEERVFDRPLAKLIPGAREALRALKDAGHTIVIYTARGWAEYNYTKAWLDQHDVPYDAIQMGKPIAHVWIDDRAIRFRKWEQALEELRADFDA